MSQRTRNPVVFLVLLLGLLVIQGLTGCSEERRLVPSAPSAQPQITTPSTVPIPAGALVVFREPATGFATSDLRDAHGRIIQLNNAGDLIWTPDGTHVPGYELSPDVPPTYFIGSRPTSVATSVSSRFDSEPAMENGAHT